MQKRIYAHDFQHQSNKFIILLIFTFFFLIYITSSSGHFDPWDGTEYFLITESIALKHSVKLYPELSMVPPLLPDYVVHNPMYIERALLAPAIAIPFYYAALIFSFLPQTVVALFANSFIMSLICVVLFCFSLHLYKSKKIALVLTLIFGVCSFIWPYNNSLMTEPTTTLCIFASAYFIYMSTRQYNLEEKIVNNRRYLIDGTISTKVVDKNKDENKRAYLAALGALFLGLSLISHPSSIVVIPGFLAYYIFFSIRHSNNRKILLLSFFTVLGSVLLFVAFTNYIRFGSFHNFGYGDAESLSRHSGWHGLVGLLISPGRGLVFYFPIAILLPLTLSFMYTKNKGLFFVCTYTFAALWLFFGSMIQPEGSSLAESQHWGGDYWGPRYLAPLLPFITLTLGTLLERLKGNKLFLKVSAIIILSTAGFLVNLLGILVWWAWFLLNHDQLQGYELMTWDPYHSFIVNHIGFLMSDYISHVRPVEFTYTSYGLAPCSYNVYLYCEFGILPILLLSTVIAIVATIILMKISNFKRPLFIPKSLHMK